MERAVAQLIGYGFPVLAALLLIRPVVDRLWDCVSPGGSRNPMVRPEPWQPQVLALIEVVLYVAFLQLGEGLFIVLWLALKVAGHWKRWEANADEKLGKPDGQQVFNLFLTGNALAVVYAVVGFKLIGWISAQRPYRPYWVPLAVIALTLVLWAWLARFRKPALPTN